MTVPVILFFLVAMVYVHPFVLCRLIFIERDLSAFFIPPRYLWVELAKSFHTPLWNPYNYSGIPLLATLQPGVLYPPHILYFLLPFQVAWNWIIILHFPFAGATVYALLRSMKVSREAAFAGGITFMFSGYLLSVHSLLSHLLAVPWLPLVMLCFLRYAETGRIKNLVFSAVFLVMEFLAGAPEIVVMTLMVLCLMIPFLDSFVPGVEMTYVRRAGGLLLIVILFLLISAVQLWPFYELKMESIRRDGLSYAEATVWSFSWRDLIQFFLRDPFGNFATLEKYWGNQTWLKTLYLGFTPFFLSLLFFVRREKKRLFFLLLMGISLALALGKNMPLYKYLYHLPPFDSMRYPVKYLSIFFVAISLTTAFGIEALKKGVGEKDKRISIALRVFFYIGFAFALIWGYLSMNGSAVHNLFEKIGFKPDVYNDISVNIHNIKRLLFFAIIFCVAMLAYLRVKKYKRGVILAIIALLALDLYFANYHYFQSGSFEVFMKKHPFAGKMETGVEGARYLFTPKTAREYSLFPSDREAMSPAYAALFGVSTVGGAEVFRIQRHEYFARLMEAVPSLDAVKRYLNILGIRYFVTCYKITDKDFRMLDSIHVKGKKDAYLYEFMPFAGRFLFYGTSRFASTDKDVMGMLADPAIDLNRELILSGPGTRFTTHGEVRGMVRPISLEANRVTLQTETDSDGYLYCADTYYPGWRAYIDGKKTDMYRADLAFRAVYVPEGVHRVEFRYMPLSFYGGLAITLFGIGVCAYLIRREARTG